MTCIRFSVSVPVLSVQITVVEPSVSTADSRLTSAPRLASRRTPIASARVIVGSRPSGTFPSSSPIANEIEPASERPARIPSGTNAAPIAIATTAMIQATLRTSSSSGLGSLLRALRERRDAAQLGLHPGRERQRTRLAAGAGRAAEHEIRRLEERTRLTSAAEASR